MRVIAGQLRGRILLGPRDRTTRPITDRVKENLFNILAPHLDAAVVADCCCGTGSLGIEALSRGASFAVFAEIDGTALRLLRENITNLGLADRARIVRHDVLRKGLPISEPPFSLAFLDPPYRITETAAERLWSKLAESADTVTADAIIVWRHDGKVTLDAPPAVADRLEIFDRRTYGSQTLTFIRRRP